MNRCTTDFAYSLSKYLSSYLVGQRGVSGNTIVSYRDTFRIFLKYCQSEHGLKPDKIQLCGIDRELIEKFLLWLEYTKGNSITTRNQRLAALHAFFRYLQMENPEKISLCQSILAIPPKKTEKTIVNYLSLEGIKSILSMPDTQTKYGRRDLVLLSLLYDTGARVSELANATLADLRLDSPVTIRLVGKGNRARIVPLIPATADMLKRYLTDFPASRLSHDNTPLFANRLRRKLSRAGISYLLKKYADMAKGNTPGILPKTISPHCLRHSKAIHLLQAGVNLIYIRDLLGHAHLKTTEIYARIDSASKRKAIESVSSPVGEQALPSWTEDGDLLTWLQQLGTTI